MHAVTQVSECVVSIVWLTQESRWTKKIRKEDRNSKFSGFEQLFVDCWFCLSSIRRWLSMTGPVASYFCLCRISKYQCIASAAEESVSVCTLHFYQGNSSWDNLVHGTMYSTRPTIFSEYCIILWSYCFIKHLFKVIWTNIRLKKLIVDYSRTSLTRNPVTRQSG